MFADGSARRFVWRSRGAPLPHRHCLALEARLLVENGKVFQRREVPGVQVDGSLELLDAFEYLPLFAVEQGQVKMEPVGERVDPDAALQVLDRQVDLT